MRRLAILRLVNQEGWAPNPELVLNQMQVPAWAEIVHWHANNDAWPTYLEIMFEDVLNKGHFYETPVGCLPPILFVSESGVIDWHSLDRKD